MRPGIRAQGTGPPHSLVPAGRHATARHRVPSRWRISAGRKGRARQGPGAGAARAAARPDDARRVRGGLGSPADPDDPPRRIVRPRPPVRHHLVPGGDPQIPLFAERGPARLVLPAAARPGLAAVLPGGDRQGAGAPLARHARCAGARAIDDVGIRDGAGNSPHPSVLAHHQPHRRRARRAPVSPSAGAADGLFPGAARRRFDRAGPRTGEHPQFPHQLGPDARDRSVLHDRLPGRDVLLLAAVDLDRARLVPVLYRDLGRRDAVVPAAAGREIPARCREPGLSGRERHRDRNAEGDGGRAADAAALGGAACRLCEREFSRAHASAIPRARPCSSSARSSPPASSIAAPGS